MKMIIETHDDKTCTIQIDDRLPTKYDSFDLVEERGIDTVFRTGYSVPEINLNGIRSFSFQAKCLRKVPFGCSMDVE